MVKIIMWQPKYNAQYYVVDDITGEIYAHTTVGLRVIKEQAYLDQAVALEAAAAEFLEMATAKLPLPTAPKMTTDQTKKRGKN